jgi:hypothetical protein
MGVYPAMDTRQGLSRFAQVRPFIRETLGDTRIRYFSAYQEEIKTNDSRFMGKIGPSRSLYPPKEGL